MLNKIAKIIENCIIKIIHKAFFYSTSNNKTNKLLHCIFDCEIVEKQNIFLSISYLIGLNHFEIMPSEWTFELRIF